jgi:putative nucleotidyltransferase with HDIG domain
MKRHYPTKSVASGSFLLGGPKKEILEAYLGTCVGVTLCDKKEKIGGLVHILLPEPTGMDRFWHPENYATTAVPLFIESLCREGASKENLEACMAGGALVGPLSERDLELDIGGRTAEIVEGLLTKEGIPVGKAETGGFFSCRLSLNMETWETQIEPLGPVDKETARDFRKPTPEEWEEAMRQVVPIPQIALKIIRMIREQEYAMDEMAKTISQDQVISAKIISLCNSSFFNMKEPITSIERALILLGEKQLLQLVLSAALDDFFPKTEQGYSLCKGGLYKHALGTAMAAEKLAHFTGYKSPDLAFTAGLLHDIGKVVLDQYIAPIYPLFYRKTQEEATHLIEAEEEIFGISHPRMGGWLADRWDLPEELVDTIRFHHEPDKSTLSRELNTVIYLADVLISSFMVGQELERMDTLPLSSHMKAIGLKPEQLPVIIDSIPPQIFAGNL